VLTPLSLDDARRIVADYVASYNNLRLHSAIGYVTPATSSSRAPAILPPVTVNWPRPRPPEAATPSAHEPSPSPAGVPPAIASTLCGAS